MKIFYGLGIVVTLFFLVISCKKEIDLKSQTPPGQLYANAILNPDSVFRVYLSYSIPITASTEVIEERILRAANAEVLIKDENDQLVDSLQLSNIVFGNVYFLIFDSFTGKKPLPNTTYNLEVSEPYIANSKIITAETTIPIAPSLNFVRATKTMPLRTITGSDETFRINLAWEDPDPSDQNLYIIETTYKNTDLFSSYPYTELTRSELYSFNSDNDNQEVGKKTDKFFYIFIDDEKLQNRQSPDSIYSTIAVLTQSFNQWFDIYGSDFTSEILINIHHVNKELYDYYKDVEKYRINTSSETDVFAQPIPVRGNTKGGLGFFGGEVIHQASLRYQ